MKHIVIKMRSLTNIIRVMKMSSLTVTSENDGNERHGFIYKGLSQYYI